MSTHKLFEEAVRYGRILERGNLSEQERYEAKLVFEAALERAETEDFRKVLRAALWVLTLV